MKKRKKGKGKRSSEIENKRQKQIATKILLSQFIFPYFLLRLTQGNMIYNKRNSQSNRQNLYRTYQSRICLVQILLLLLSYHMLERRVKIFRISQQELSDLQSEGNEEMRRKRKKNDVRSNIIRRNNIRTNYIRRSKIRAGRYKIV